MKFRIIALTLLAMSLTPPAMAEWNTIGAMHRGCKGFLANDQTVEGFEQGVCIGFVLSEIGWRDLACFYATMSEGITDPGVFTKNGGRSFSGHSYTAIIQAFVNWGDDHPQLWADQTDGLAQNEEIWAEFPCEPKN